MVSQQSHYTCFFLGGGEDHVERLVLTNPLRKRALVKLVDPHSGWEPLEGGSSSEHLFSDLAFRQRTHRHGKAKEGSPIGRIGAPFCQSRVCGLVLLEGTHVGLHWGYLWFCPEAPA